jgi:hypothetical protein
MNGASARRRPRRARVVASDPNAGALVIEREITDDLDGQPWPPPGRDDDWHLVRSYPDSKQTLWRRIRIAHAPTSPGARDPVR